MKIKQLKYDISKQYSKKQMISSLQLELNFWIQIKLKGFFLDSWSSENVA